MTTEAATKELTPQQIWDEEVNARENPTDAKSAVSTQTETEEQIATDDPVVIDDDADSKSKATGAEDDKNTGEDDKTTVAETETKPDPMALILEKLEKLEGRQRNVEGHIGGLKTAQQALHTAMEAARTQATKEDAEAPTKGQVAAAAANPQKWDDLKKDFPEWAEATEELLGSRLAALQAPKGGVDPAELEKLVTERLEQASASMREEIVNSALDAVMPGWADEVKTAKFAQWIQAQPKEIQDLAASPKVGDAARMLKLYDAAKQADPSTQIQQDRKQKLAQATSLPKGGSVPKSKTIADMTPEELWNYEAKKREDERAKRGY